MELQITLKSTKIQKRTTVKIQSVLCTLSQKFVTYPYVILLKRTTRLCEQFSHSLGSY